MSSNLQGTFQLANVLGAIEAAASASAELATEARLYYAERGLVHEARTSRDRAINNPFFVTDWLDKTLVRTLHDGTLARDAAAQATYNHYRKMYGG